MFWRCIFFGANASSSTFIRAIIIEIRLETSQYYSLKQQRKQTLQLNLVSLKHST